MEIVKYKYSELMDMKNKKSTKLVLVTSSCESVDNGVFLNWFFYDTGKVDNNNAIIYCYREFISRQYVDVLKDDVECLLCNVSNEQIPKFEINKMIIDIS